MPVEPVGLKHRDLMDAVKELAELGSRSVDRSYNLTCMRVSEELSKTEVMFKHLITTCHSSKSVSLKVCAYTSLINFER